MFINLFHGMMKINPSSYAGTDEFICYIAGNSHDVGGSAHDIDFNGSSVDKVSFTWKICNFLSRGKEYSETFLTDDLRWLASPTIHILKVCKLVLSYGPELPLVCALRRMLMYPMGNTVDNLSVYLDVRGASELPLGWSRCVQFSLTVVNQLQHSLSITRGILFPFCFVYFTYMFGFFFCCLDINVYGKVNLFNGTSDCCILLWFPTQFFCKLQESSILRRTKYDNESEEKNLKRIKLCLFSCMKSVILDHFCLCS